MDVLVFKNIVGQGHETDVGCLHAGLFGDFTLCAGLKTLLIFEPTAGHTPTALAVFSYALTHKELTVLPDENTDSNPGDILHDVNYTLPESKP